MRGCDLETSGKVWLYRPRLHKTEHHGHERIIHIGPKAQAVVRQWLTTDFQAYLFNPAAEAEANLREWTEHLTPRSWHRSKRSLTEN